MNSGNKSMSPRSQLREAAERVPEGRKVYVNGQVVQGVGELVYNVGEYNGRVNITFHPEKMIVTKESIRIDLGGDTRRYSKGQLKELIVNNLDNNEAIQWIEKLKLNRED